MLIGAELCVCRGFCMADILHESLFWVVNLLLAVRNPFVKVHWTECKWDLLFTFNWRYWKFAFEVDSDDEVVPAPDDDRCTDSP